MILERARQAEILEHPEGLARLMGVIATTFDRYPDMMPLSAVVDALSHPLSIDAVEAVLFERVLALSAASSTDEAGALDKLIRHALDLPTGLPDADASSYPTEFQDDLLSLVAHQRTTWRLDAERDQAMIEAIVATRTTTDAHLRRVLDELNKFLDSPVGRADIEALLAAGFPVADVELVKRAATGEVQGALMLGDSTLLVIGTDADNTYDMSLIDHIIDTGGDDTYWAKTAAAQSGSWDECATMFIDQDGQDRYAPAGRDSLGRSGIDTYHYDRDKVLSFSFFLDADGAHDAYPPRRTNNTPGSSNIAQATGQENADEPAKSTRFGIFIDE